MCYEEYNKMRSKMKGRVRASSHERHLFIYLFFVAAADYFMAVRTDGERIATFSHFPYDLVQAVFGLHKHDLVQ
jgi:hypothetical protein